MNKLLISKFLITTCIYYHIYCTIYDPTQNKRFEINSINNVHKYFHAYPNVFYYLSNYVQEVVIGCLLCSGFMLVSKRTIIKIIVIIGTIFYNILILHFHVIVPNYYSLRQWIAILGGIFAILAIQIEQEPQSIQQSKKQN